MALELAELKFIVNDSDLKRASDTIGNLVTNVGKLDKAARDAAQTEVVLAKAAKLNADANLQNAKAQDVRLKSTITADKADQQATAAIERKTKATEKATESSAKNVGVLQRQKDILEFQTQGFSRGQSSILAYAKAAGLAAEDIGELGKVLETQRKLMGGDPFDKSLSGLKSLRNQYTELKEAMRQYAADSNLTAKQTRELARDKERLIEKMKVEGASFSEIRQAVRAHNAEYVNLATSYNKMTSAEDAVIKSRKEAVNATNYLTQADQKMAAALNTSNAALDKAGTDSLVKYESALRKSGVSQDVATQKLATYKAQLAQVAAVEEKRRAQHLARALTPQISDVAVSLWSGQNPLTVLLQQGAQINDMFQLSGVAAADFGKTVKEAFSSMLPSIRTVVKGVGGLIVDGFMAAGNATRGFIADIFGVTGAMDKFYMKLSENGPSKFGGMIQTASSIMTGVFAVGVGVVIAGLAMMAKGAYDSMIAVSDLNKAMVLGGNAFNMTGAQALAYADTLSSANVSTLGIIEVMTEMSKVGGFTADQIALVSKAAISMQDYAGVAIKDTVKQFSELGKDPVKALLELAKKTGELTVEQIKSVEQLQKQGRAQDAVNLAMKISAGVMDKQSQSLRDQLHPLEKLVAGWKILGRWMWDVTNIAPGTSDALELINKKERLAKSLAAGVSENVPENVALKQEIALLEAKTLTQAQSAANRQAVKDEAAAYQQYSGALAEFDKQLNKADASKMKRQDFINAKIQELGVLENAGKYESTTLNTDRIKQFFKVYGEEWDKAQEKTKKDPSENYFATIMREATNASIKAEDATKSLTASQVKLLETVNDPRFLELSKVKQEIYLSTMAANVATEQQTALTEKLAEAEELRGKILGTVDGLGKDYYKTIDKLNALVKSGAMGQDEANELVKALGQTTPFAKAMSEWFAKATEAVAKSNIETKLQLANIQAQNMELDHNLAMVGLSEEAQKRLTTEFTKQRDLMKANAEYEKIRSDIMKDGSYGTDENKNEALENAASVYQATLAQINRKAVDDLFTYYTSKAAEAGKNSFGSFAEVLKSAGELSFSNAVSSIGELINSFGTLIEQQTIYNQLRSEAKGDTEKLSKLDKAAAQNQMKSYGDITKSLKGFFKEGTKGYKALHTAEKVFRAFEMAMAVKNAALKIGLQLQEIAATASAQTTLTSVTATGEATRNAIKIPGVFTAFMSMLGPWGIPAAVAALAAVGLATSGGSAKVPTTNQGTGTVFGDPEAKSESIKNSLDILKDVNTLTMQYSEKMLSSLRSIENRMAGVTNLILRSSGIEAAASGITEGTKLPSVFDFGVVSKIPVVGKLVGSLFGTKTKITGQGVYAEDTKLEDVMSKGIEAGYYADINKKKKAFGFTYSNKNSTNKTIDDQLSKQFTLIIENFLDVITSVAPVLGFTTDQIDANLKDFVVKIGKIDLKDLSGEEIQEKLTAVFGAAGDDMAKAALPGFEKFQQVGEGYLETVVRVSYATESLRGMMDTLGVSTALSVDSAMGLVDTFGGLEIARDKLGAYYDAFYTEAERNATLQRQLTREFAAQNLELPTTKEEYRKLVEAQDLNTESGRELYTTLITLAPAFASVVSATEELNSRSVELQIEKLRLLGQEEQALAMERDIAIKGLTDYQIAMWDANKTAQAYNQSLSSVNSLIPTVLKKFLSEDEWTKHQTNEVANSLVKSNVAFKDITSAVNWLTAATKEQIEVDTRALFDMQGLTIDQKKVLLESASIMADLKDTSSKVAEDIKNAFTKAGDDIVAYIKELTIGRAGLATPMELLDKTRQVYTQDLAAANAGDSDAAGRLVQSAKAYIDAQKTVTASSSFTNDVIKTIIGQLSGLGFVKEQLMASNAPFIPQFANGGTFDSGIVSKPTLFNIGQMGEAGPEAIMPLSRTSGGRLGVTTDNSSTNRLIAQLIVEVKALREQQSQETAGIISTNISVTEGTAQAVVDKINEKDRQVNSQPVLN